MKPRIRMYHGAWMCESEQAGIVFIGYGPTPAEAYEVWRWAA